MRTKIIAALVTLAFPALAAEPSMSHQWVQVPGMNAQDCMQRGRTAMSANGFTLAESTNFSQYATQGDYVGLVTCIPTQPTAFVVVVSGPTSAQAGDLARRVRDQVTGNPAAPAQPRPAPGTGTGPL